MSNNDIDRAFIKLDVYKRQQLYNVLTAPEYHMGIRSGVIPIYIAAVFHEFSEKIILQNDLGQLPLSADTLQMINACPEDYTLVFLEWNPEKDVYKRQGKC